jgi:hypothetical protein
MQKIFRHTAKKKRIPYAPIAVKNGAISVGGKSAMLNVAASFA